VRKKNAFCVCRNGDEWVVSTKLPAPVLWPPSRSPGRRLRPNVPRCSILAHQDRRGPDTANETVGARTGHGWQPMKQRARCNSNKRDCPSETGGYPGFGPPTRGLTSRGDTESIQALRGLCSKTQSATQTTRTYQPGRDRGASDRTPKAASP